MNWTHFAALGAGLAGGWLAKWLHGTLKISPKSAQEGDVLLGTPGSTQGLADGVESGLDNAIGNVVQNTLPRNGK